METKPVCPHCSSDKVSYSGKYKRKRSRHLIQRYKCSQCNKTFSDQTCSQTFRQKRPEINSKILELSCSKMGIRKLAKAVKASKNTVQSRIKFLSNLCDEFQNKYMSKWKIKPQFQFDEMESYEHSKHATIGIPVIVEKNSHFLVGAVAQYVKSRSQYPTLRDKHNSAHENEIQEKDKIIKEQLKLCRTMKPQGRIIIDTDGDNTYPKYIKEVFGNESVHSVYISGDDVNKTKLFPVNNMCGCLRDDVAMLLRRTRNGCKNISMLSARLSIYKFFSNFLKKKEYSRYWKDDKGKKHKTILSFETPAMKLGIFDSPVGYQFLLNSV